MTTQRGLACLTGAAWGNARGAWRGVGDDITVHLSGDGDDGGRVRQALRTIDDLARAAEVAEVAGVAGVADVADVADAVLFMLSYEACVALDARLPRRPASSPTSHRPAPDVLVRRVVRAAAPPSPSSASSSSSSLVVGAARVRAPDDVARADHESRIHAARERLLDGVIYQANLAHRLTVERASHDGGLAFFQAHTTLNAPPCAAFVDVPSWGSVISLSPERFVARGVKDGHDVATTWPIKGTRPRGSTPADDARLLDELCRSEKDAAEHVMIVDLLRNDLGKVAVPGGVTVQRLLDVVSVKNVHHLESTVVARLRDGVSHGALLAATVPGGSITGAPKSSAIEVIHALEAGPRGLYTGVLGLAHGRSLMSSLLIRTWLRPDDEDGALHVGGGIVVDSVPAHEWQETLDKARAFQ